MKQDKSFASLIFLVIMGLGAAVIYATHGATLNTESIAIGVGCFVVAMLALSAIQIAAQWDKRMILAELI